MVEIISEIRHQDSLKAALLILPTLVFLAILFTFPFLITVEYSIAKVDQFNRLVQRVFRIDNYLFKDAHAQQSTPV